MNLLTTNHVEIDFTYSGFHMISFGFCIGSNSFTGKRPDNLFIEIEFMFWSLGIEVTRNK